MGDYVVIRSELIADAREARRYYEERIAGRPHIVSCHGRPATLFFDKQGKELADFRVTGYQDAAQFLQSLQSAGI